MLTRRFFVVAIILILGGCKQVSSPPGQLSVGVVSYGESVRSVEQYAEFKDYLGQELKSLIELEPTYNEVQAIVQIERKTWDIVFAPPGLAAIAISESKYTPVFPLEGTLETRSVIIVLEESPMKKLADLAGKTLALGQMGSATGYYLPIFNLYGLTLAKISFASTPKRVLELISNGEVNAGAMSLAEFNRYRPSFANTRFRVLFTDSHEVPSGAVLISPNLTPQQQEQIRAALADVSSAIASSSGYIPNAAPPNYDYLIQVVGRVRQISERVKQEPAPLY
ncbi:phosphate/phosphite/phosphonate ABC transporter substrate-binding protein [Gloeothece verrucosa]|uniref:Phosphonate ABC transporter, periplasmic phosphonate-binding protein n=1 Tax=Gloeothece verrucosa (strain PCC 7822) TaxID=497965 RepID=E0UEQ7_GLOV7|nr:PhnD/SsuA/transferrin family substrate-binding protein [Gloeothece verrucosa]ADN16625.1 conserved hypothetical protein [Gloeothece verrucosa PCC 7822]